MNGISWKMKLLFKVRGLIKSKGTSESSLDNGFSQESFSICGA